MSLTALMQRDNQTSLQSLNSNSSPTTLGNRLHTPLVIPPSRYRNASGPSVTPSSTLSIMSSENIAPPTLTPITNNDLSPPERLSPRSRKRNYDEMQSDNLPSPHHLSSDALQHSFALTPTPTPPEFERHARPGPGEVKGLKLVFDPQTATATDDKDKRKYKPKYMSFGDKVCAASNQVLLLI
jgi:hypothetical protein